MTTTTTTDATTTSGHPRRNRLTLAAATAAAVVSLAACGGSTPNAGGTPSSGAPSGSAPSSTAPAKSGGAKGAAAGQVLPVTKNPITNTATAKTLAIDSVIVENNVDSAGKAVGDHLEIALKNTGTTALSGLEAFYTFTDPTTGTSESYYTELKGLTVPAGGSQTVNFDNTGVAGHYPVNQYSLYYTSKNALEVKVEVSAKGAAIQTSTVKKDAGGAEAPD